MNERYNSSEYERDRALNVARELAPYLNNPPAHVRETARRVQRWYEIGLPKAHSAEVLNSACNF